MSSTARQELYECFTYNGTKFFVSPSDSMIAVGSLDIVPGWCVRVLKAAKDGTFSTTTMIAVDISVPLDGMSGEHGMLKVLTPNPEALTYVQAAQCIDLTRLPFAVERHGQSKLARQPAREAPTEEEP